MGWEAVFCLFVVGLVLAGLIANRATDVLLVGALVLTTLAGITSAEEAFAGFANTSMLTVGALYVVTAALRETGALDTVGRWILGHAKSEKRVLTRLAGSVTVMSAFLNNTPIVAMFIPILTKWCKQHGVAPSRLLLPLSYLCIFGGTCTLIGTSTNLVVNGLMEEASTSNPTLSETLRPMGFFELSFVGIPYALVGILYLLTIGGRLLPDHQELIDKLTDSVRNYLVNVKVRPECKLVGRTVEEGGLRHLPGLFLIEIVRSGESISPVTPDQRLLPDDILTFTGVVETIKDLERIPGLEPVGDKGYESHGSMRKGKTLCEAVLSGTAACIGKSIRAVDFRAAYGAAVVAVHRGGMRLGGKVGDVVLRHGDTLLLQTDPHFVRANRNNPAFLLVSGIADTRPIRFNKAIISLGLLLLLVVLMTTGAVQIVTAAFFVAIMMIVTRCISAADARQSIDWRILITIAAAFGLGKALVNAGIVDATSGLLVTLTVGLGPYAVLAGVYIITSLFTEMVTNNAAAALMFPFAVAIAEQLGLNPRPFVMAVAFAASASFMTPLGYQTNLMVFGPGAYRFSDFVRVGLPLNLILLSCATVLIPFVWSFKL